MGRKLFLVIFVVGSFLAPAGAQEKTEFGGVISNSFATRWAGLPPVMKGIAVRLGDGTAAACFDTDHLRCAGAWVGWSRRRFLSPSITKNWPMLLELQGVSFRASLHPGGPIIRGDIRFVTWPEAGWTGIDGRAVKGRYRGFYVNGERVIFSYEVDGAGVLEMYEVVKKEGMVGFSRTIQLGAHAGDLNLAVCELPGAHEPRGVVGNEFMVLDEAVPLMGTYTVAGVIGAAPLWEVRQGRVRLRLAGSGRESVFKLVIWNGRQEEVGGFEKLFGSAARPQELLGLCGGGPARWGVDVTSAGVRGVDDQAYVLDTLNLPVSNPWQTSMRLAAMDFFADGRAAVSTLGGEVWIVAGIDEKLTKLHWRRFATGLYQAVGLKIVEGQIYVLGRDQITRLHDLNGDGEADFYENFNNAGIVSERQDECNLGMETDGEGNFYFSKAGAGVTPDRLHAHTGTMLKVPKNGEGIEVIATGLRSSNGLAIGPNGEMVCGDNEGTWSPASRINLIRRGGFYGQMETSHRTPAPKDFDQPMVWLPRAFDTSPAGLVWAGKDWGPLSGHLLGMSYGQSALYHVMSEEVEGVVQGAVFKLPLKFASGAMRGRFSPVDGQLYVCGLKGWQTNAGNDGSLQRVRFTGKGVVMPVEFHAAKNGVFITFSEALDLKSAGDAQNWGVERWNYKWQNKYGSPELSLIDPKKPKHDEVGVEGVKISGDGRRVWIKCEDLKPVMQMKIQYKVRDGRGRDLRGEIYNTVHRLGVERGI
ncbi:MAG TPA: DUF6797 domain-containing protein [Tepidisphaeraceae bacterium]|nr:DUF6797 domain-containing protein [Tepidisphaeraceae bacterium]